MHLFTNNNVQLWVLLEAREWASAAALADADDLIRYDL
jgi:hypothetical protein